MSSSAALNHGKRCVQELDNFEHLMGWTLRNLTGKDQHDVDPDVRAAKHQELSCTAFGEVVAIPCEFVSPVDSLQSLSKAAQKAAKQKTKKRMTGAHSNIYRKRPTGATASSNARASAAGSSAHTKQSGAACTPEPSASSAAARNGAMSSPRSPVKKDSKPVDFVYDVNVRRKLRDEIDNERAKVLHDAAVKEARLRAAHKWVYDKADQSDRKQAWNGRDRPPHASRAPGSAYKKTASDVHGGNETTRHDKAEPAVRASSAASSRSSSYSTSSKVPTKTAKSVKSSIAPNVSEWRTQAFPVHPSAEAAKAEWKRAECQRMQQQWREAKDVQETIDDFETRMQQQWAI